MEDLYWDISDRVGVPDGDDPTADVTPIRLAKVEYELFQYYLAAANFEVEFLELDTADYDLGEGPSQQIDTSYKEEHRRRLRERMAQAAAARRRARSRSK